MNDTTIPPVPALKPAPAVLRATISITRKATGLTEHYQITGTPVAATEPAAEPAATPEGA